MKKLLFFFFLYMSFSLILTAQYSDKHRKDETATILTHMRNGNISESHHDANMNFIGWGEHSGKWSLKIVGDRFLLAPDGDYHRAVKSDHINYLSWGGERDKWIARIVDGKFMISKKERSRDSRSERSIDYLSWGGYNDKWKAKIDR